VADVPMGLPQILRPLERVGQSSCDLPPILSVAAGILKRMTIHFICTGNIYRSRLAEMYCASKGVPGLFVCQAASEPS
jgi:hypothetical protein